MRGKRPVGSQAAPTHAEHPRVCGENSWPKKSSSSRKGTSPRMRGKPSCLILLRASQSEHPRVCGENSALLSVASSKPGTSPRMRGKRPVHQHGRRCVRNIPAYAGKTPDDGCAARETAEHPRVCGENSAAWAAVMTSCGTSPRMRGKHQGVRGVAKGGRNIPAYAGKTIINIACDNPDEEHPRVCGENRYLPRRFQVGIGTSPRMRGKRKAW